MKPTFLVLAWTGCLPLGAAPPNVALSCEGRFQILQIRGEHPKEWLRFERPESSDVPLQAFPWPGLYFLSPDGRWLCRMQKVGSGDAIAMLYQIESNGRVSEVLGFDAQLWKEWDAATRVKHLALFHTGIASISWSTPTQLLHLTLSGKDPATDAPIMELPIEYDLESHQVHSRTVTSDSP
ncbi:hypothetical protein HNR46_001782 [Haloferula luteola]|uniref:Uncharacterized protein n=1 Tax=Haloferula luteola TaxID=595692 RepID=A0A840V0M9_9BACT|nr:hypothetical protein [Haloferula luteola]MBB5351545.1 hypothetical protein [Haloferula luteola]